MNSYCIIELFNKSVSKFSTNIAVERGEEKISYEELSNEINSLACTLAHAGVKKNDFIVVLSDDPLEVLISMIAIWKLGCVFIPLSPSDRAARLKVVLKELVPQFILTSDANIGEVNEVSKDWSPAIISLSYKKKSKSNFIIHAPCPIGPDEISYIYFTSGSTGKPKGIMGRYKAIRHFIEWEIKAFELKEGLRVSQLIVPIFDAFLRDILVPLCVGGTICIPPNREFILDGNRLSDWIETTQINLIHCVPSIFRSIINANLGAKHFDALKYILLSGEPLLPVDVKKWMDHFNNHVQLVNLYGASETTMVKFFYLVQPEDQHRAFIPIGKPMPGAVALILNDRNKVCAKGEIGEIHVRTPYRSLGYYNQPHLTDEVFIKNPFSSDPDDLVYKTGDFGRLLDTGDFECLGRKDQQVKIRGIRIELDEINNLLRKHEAVADVAVIDVKDGQGNNYLCAYVVLCKEVTLNVLSNYVSQFLPEYMIPSAFVIMESLPRGMTGKLNRKSLPQPEYFSMQSGDRMVKPTNPYEEILINIWANVLGVKTLSVHANFFQLGGHSLLATQLISKVREKLHLELPLRTLFKAPTVFEFSKEVINIKSSGPVEVLSPIPKNFIQKKIPLSFAQERLWFLDKLEEGSGQYNIAAGLRLEGSINPLTLKEAFQKLIMRHESLRTIFVNDQGIPQQIIEDTPRFHYEVIDLQKIYPDLDKQSIEEKMCYLAKDESAQGFDLARGPLIRAKLYQLRKEVHVLIVTIHHIVADGWSMNIVMNDLRSLYLAELKNEKPNLSELPIQYADFSIWQRQSLSGKILEEKLRYWKNLLAGHSGILELPTDYPRPLLQSFSGGEVKFNVSKDVKNRLDVLNQTEGCTLFMTLVSALSVLINRWTDERDLLIGFPIANRNRAEVENLIGLFANTLLLRVNLKKELTFKQLLDQVKNLALEIYLHQDIPFEKLVEELKIKRDLGRNPLFQVMFILQNQKIEPPQSFDGIRLTPFEIESQSAKFDLTFKILETPESLEGIIEYNASLFDKSTIQRMARHLEILLEKIASDSDALISELKVLAPEEQHQLIIEWNDTKRNYLETNICQLFEKQVEYSPDAIALIFEDRKLSYSELNDQSSLVANYLIELGVGLESLVGICIERSPEMVIAILGILKAGAAYLPLDPAYPKERFLFILEDAKVKFIISQKDLKAKIPNFKGKILEIEDILSQKVPLYSKNITTNGSLSSLAYVIYTSGSTGKPKGVQISHRSLNNFLCAMKEKLSWTSKDRILAITTLSFDIAGLELYLPLTKGGQVEILSKDVVQSGQELYNKLLSSPLSTMQATPITWQMLLAAGWKGEGINKILCGGERLTEGLAQELLQTEKELWNLYGPTETTIWSIIKKIEKGKVVNLGRPIANTQIYILDKDFHLNPIGISGEIYIGGLGVARGYLQRADLTAERFIPDPYSEEPGSRLYKTGDLGRYLPDGTINFLNRLDYQVKIRGFRVELEEIERTLRKYPGIQEAVVLASKDTLNPQLEGYFLTNEDTVDVRSLQAFLSEYLPSYMVPTTFVKLERFPLTPNGKIDRQALQQNRYAVLKHAETFISPRNRTEELLVDIWSQLLNIDTLGVYDNFFEIGGHSLLATQLISRIEKQFEIKLSLQILFQAPTIAGIAFHLLAVQRIEKEMLNKHDIILEEKETVLF